MWLLDHNLPVQLRLTLADLGMSSETVVSRGWAKLRNGELVSAAYQSGFRVLLTRDRGFAVAAAPVLLQFTDFALVVVRLPQRSWRLYESAFRTAWSVGRIEPLPGRVIEWPSR